MHTCQAEEQREAQHKEVPAGVEVDTLQVGQAHRRDHPEHDVKDPSDHGVGDGEEKGPELGEQAQEHHDEAGALDHPPAGHLRSRRGSTAWKLP